MLLSAVQTSTALTDVVIREVGSDVLAENGSFDEVPSTQPTLSDCPDATAVPQKGIKIPTDTNGVCV